MSGAPISGDRPRTSAALVDCRRPSGKPPTGSLPLPFDCTESREVVLQSPVEVSSDVAEDGFREDKRRDQRLDFFFAVATEPVSVAPSDSLRIDAFEGMRTWGGRGDAAPASDVSYGTGSSRTVMGGQEKPSEGRWTSGNGAKRILRGMEFERESGPLLPSDELEFVRGSDDRSECGDSDGLLSGVVPRLGSVGALRRMLGGGVTL